MFDSGWALTGIMLLILASQALMVGTISLLLKHGETRINRLIRREMSRQDSFVRDHLERPAAE